MTLSVCIIFHNQKQFIKRCLDSILSQKINFDYEILLSDDNSTDGTWEELLEWKTKHPDLISCYRINTNDYNPVSNSQRSGLNRFNIYKEGLLTVTMVFCVLMTGVRNLYILLQNFLITKDFVQPMERIRERFLKKNIHRNSGIKISVNY